MSVPYRLVKFSTNVLKAHMYCTQQFESWYILAGGQIHMYMYLRDGQWHVGSEMMQMIFPSDELNFVLVF